MHLGFEMDTVVCLQSENRSLSKIPGEKGPLPGRDTGTPNPRGDGCLGLYYVTEFEASLGYTVEVCSQHSSGFTGQCLCLTWVLFLPFFLFSFFLSDFESIT